MGPSPSKGSIRRRADNAKMQKLPIERVRDVDAEGVGAGRQLSVAGGHAKKGLGIWRLGIWKYVLRSGVKGQGSGPKSLNPKSLLLATRALKIVAANRDRHGRRLRRVAVDDEDQELVRTQRDPTTTGPGMMVLLCRGHGWRTAVLTSPFHVANCSTGKCRKTHHRRGTWE